MAIIFIYVSLFTFLQYLTEILVSMNMGILWKWYTNEAFFAVVKTHKRRSNKIYNSELTITKI